MQTAQLVIKSYRRKRAIVCVLFALATLFGTLTLRFISERNLNQQHLLAFTSHAVHTLERLILPLDAIRKPLASLVGMPCNDIHLELRKQAASVQTVRAIALVNRGIVYCSSVLGARNEPVGQIQPSLPAKQPQLVLSIDRSVLIGQPMLLMWYPTSADGQSGMLDIVNIGLLSTLMLEPQEPLITGVSLSVNNRHLVLGKGIMDYLPPLQNEIRYEYNSTRFPLAVSVNSPGASVLALKALPSQLPLAIMLSLMAGIIVWFLTAGRMSFAREINLGMESHEFELFCQPLIDAKNQRCDGVEILLRWHNPRQGWISPDVFIPVAEEQRLIVPLTRYVLTETQQRLHFFPADKHFHIGINIAPSHLRRGELLKDLNLYWFSAHPQQQLIIELTERHVLLDVDSRIMRELHRKGAKIAIDDFGTGNSSFAWLERLHPDVLKIDKSFTTAIGTDSVNSKVTEMIIDLGKRLHIELVAEGVETLEQVNYLRQRGVQTLQGYLFAKPMPIQDFPAWLAGNCPPPAKHNDQLMPLVPS